MTTQPPKLSMDSANSSSRDEYPSSSSSSATLTEEVVIFDLREKLDTVAVCIRPKSKQRPKQTAKKAKTVPELDYKGFLQDMNTEHAEPASHFRLPPLTLSKVLTSDDAKLQWWKQEVQHLKPEKAHKVCDNASIHSIRDQALLGLLETLMFEFGRGTHSSFLDDSYSVLLLHQERAAISFKVIKKVGLMYGDPLCHSHRRGEIFETFRSFCKKQHWRVAVIGASPDLASCPATKSWTRVEFAVEQVFNPATNTVLNQTDGKTITRTNRKLARTGTILQLYDPTKQGIRPELEQELAQVYSAWREDRCQKGAPQAYSAVINPFSMPGMTRYLFTRDESGRPNSLAGLIRLGANDGYLLEPCIQTADAPKGITGFLATNALGMLRDEGCRYMTFGVESLSELGDISSMPVWMSDASRRSYRIISDSLNMKGRQVFHESFYPEKEQKVPLYLLFPPGLPSLSVYQAVMKNGHISMREVLKRWQAATANKKREQKLLGQDAARRKVSLGQSQLSSKVSQVESLGV